LLNSHGDGSDDFSRRRQALARRQNYKVFPDAPETWKPITVRHLLTHTSGLSDYPPEVDLPRDYTKDEYLALSKNLRSFIKQARNGITAISAMSLWTRSFAK
jgi:CubicO group peptidase (beta-lactamase class C family)